ncbi:MFS transporter [Microbispora sp. KK1-11]|uniref:MFS transporter n=1 Tax=Microbispora sp. KK1-11 TaxID=2053005 RepID=UPI0011577011|nr:MFS transporter [Microbispora sp. KK1-11]TQS20818.1 MFS transporter [Microbispora sp. KK1-11]
MARRERGWIRDWEPENPHFWESRGKQIARRNLLWSIAAEHLGFTVWTVWSIVAVKLGAYRFSTDQLFWIVALPNLVGSVLRIPYTFAPARFGGRNWTVVSALLLLVPTGLLSVAVSDPRTPFWAFLVIAATAGLGGGNFASSMANITHFYPQSRQGLALGWNAAGGNIGVSSVQFVVPLVISALGLGAAGLFWIPFILASAAGAWLFMDNLTSATSPFRQQVKVAGAGQTWIMSLLYIGTFGSYIGYSTAFPVLTKTQFPSVAVTSFAFAGPLLGSLVRPIGGRLADRFGGARITAWTFCGMGAALAGVWSGLHLGSFPMFLVAFLVLFGMTGLGNGSTYRMIPAIFVARAVRIAEKSGSPAAVEDAPLRGRREGAAAIGIISAVGALGGFFVNRSFGTSVQATGGAGAALLGFGAFYIVCAGLTWWCYLRTIGSRVLPNFATARV